MLEIRGVHSKGRDNWRPGQKGLMSPIFTRVALINPICFPVEESLSTIDCFIVLDLIAA